MDLMRAFTVMLGGITAADASSRQVNGILVWRAYVYEALQCSYSVPEAEDRGSDVILVTSSETHLEWRLAAAAILDALARQANSADVAYERAVRAAAAATAAAEDYDAAAGACEANAGATDDQKEASAYLAQAEKFRVAADTCRKEAARQNAIAVAAVAWGIAARDACAFGSALVAQENAVAFPVGEAIAAAGGPDEVYGDKHALTTGSGSERPLAVRGGAR